jgi:FKBP-type peptidyl-prolyl cis-trans isomerase FklB
MKQLLIGAICLGLFACQGTTQNKTELKSMKDSVSYSIGMNIANNLKAQKIEVDPIVVGQGMKDILDSGKTLMTETQAQEVMMAFQNQLKEKHDAMVKEQGEKNKKDGEAFLAENKKKEGVIALPSGLQYKVLTQGTGPKPKATDSVTVHYRGTLLDGTEFDSSMKHGQPVTFTLNQVVRGWTEGIQLMPKGSKYQFFIPSDLAYGPNGMGNVIPPNATLIFEIELLNINGK